MQIGWKLVVFVAVLALVLAGFMNHKTATAAAPQSATPAAKTPPMASTGQGLPSETRSIPDTTLAINSPTPLSQRVVHYEIDAKYDASKHTIDATEVLTYHNLTGQPLDHFPFHLYQNAFQPKATWVQRGQARWQSRYRLRKVGRQGIRLGGNQKHRSGRAGRSDRATCTTSRPTTATRTTRPS